MFVYLKQGLVLKKKDSLSSDPIPQGPYLMCQKPDHQDNPLNIICSDVKCPKRGLLCSACFFQDHTSHNKNCFNLKDFLKNYREFIRNEKETSQKQLNEEDSEALKQGFEGIYRIMQVFKERFDEQYGKLESSLKQKELFLMNSLQNKNINDILDLLNNMSQGSINTINQYIEAVNYILEGLSGNMAIGLKDEKLKQDLLPNNMILEKVQGLKIGLEGEFQRLDALFGKVSKNCQDLLIDKGILYKNERDFLLKSDMEVFLSEIIGKNIRISACIRLFKGSEDGYQRAGVEKRLEGKQGLLALIKGNNEVFIGVYFEGGILMENDRKYVVFSLNNMKKIKEGRNWGGCSCSNKEKMLMTSSNLHEVVIYEDCAEKEESFLEKDGKIIRFSCEEMEIYEFLV